MNYMLGNAANYKFGSHKSITLFCSEPHFLKINE